MREITAQPATQADKMAEMVARAKQASAPATSTISAAERVAALKAKVRS